MDLQTFFTIACAAEEQERKDFDALDGKRRVDDVIIMAALRARISACLNGV